MTSAQWESPKLHSPLNKKRNNKNKEKKTRNTLVEPSSLVQTESQDPPQGSHIPCLLFITWTKVAKLAQQLAFLFIGGCLDKGGRLFHYKNAFWVFSLPVSWLQDLLLRQIKAEITHGVRGAILWSFLWGRMREKCRSRQ